MSANRRGEDGDPGFCRGEPADSRLQDSLGVGKGDLLVGRKARVHAWQEHDDDARCEGIPRIHSGPRHHDLAARARRTMALRGGYLERSASPRRAEMTMRKSMATSAAVGILSIALLATGAAAAEIKVLSAVAMKAAIDDLAREFERGTGHAIKVDYATAGQVRDRIRDGEAFDVAIMPASAFDP